MIRRAARHIKSLVARNPKRQGGAVLIFAALVLPVLMGMAGFAIDYGWLYWNGVKIQHGADAAALAGVIYEPDDRPLAHTEARAAAEENGYDHASASTQVTPIDFVDDPTAVENPYQLAVTITSDVPTFFMRVFGIDSIAVSKRAVAEYNLPLELGSPSSQFGNAPVCSGQSGGGECLGIWASIQGNINGRGYGDKYSSMCKNWNTTSSPSCTTDNPTHRDRGYIFGIDVPVGSTSPTVDLFDPGFNPDGNGTSPIFDRWSAGNTDDGHTVVFTLYAPTPTPLDLGSTTVVCQRSYGPGEWDDAAQTWERLCTAPDLGSGVYPLQVRIKDPIEDKATVGHNRFSIRTFASGTDPTVYAIGDFSLYSQQSAGTAEFYLARVGQEHAGKTLVLNLWDVGDAQSNAWVQPLAPTGANSWGTHPCTWEGIRGDNGDTWSNYVSGSSEATCKIVTEFPGSTTTARYNNSDLRIEIELAADYSCSTNCWWKIRIRYPSSSTDTTTWEAHIDGNPVRLVE